MSSDSPLAALLVGAALLSVGTAVTLNWRGWAERYTDLIDALLPPTRRSMTVDHWPRLLMQNRIIFGVIAVFGIGLLIAGIAGLVD